MSIHDVRPSTIEGIKRLATQYRRQRGLKHSTALDLAAQAADCANFKHALRSLPPKGNAGRSYVFLTVYWYDRDDRHRCGRETLKVALQAPILDTCSKADLKLVRGFGSMRMVAPDHFVSDGIATSQEMARKLALTAERTLRFMEHTGLRPSRGPFGKSTHPRLGDKLPGIDHASDWTDPLTGQLVVIDEPYDTWSKDAGRAAWADRHGWRVVKTAWPGMYSPYICGLFVVTDAQTGYDIDALVAKIDAMPRPSPEDAWEGESSPSWETYLSPLATTHLDARRARSRGTVYPSATKTTLPYGYGFGETRRRPAAELTIDGHQAVGSIIKAILSSPHRADGVYLRLNRVRSTLEDWMEREIRRGELDGRDYHEVYYHATDRDGPFRKRARTPDGILELLAELGTRLKSAYPDCAPLRSLLRKVDMSASLVERRMTPS